LKYGTFHGSLIGFFRGFSWLLAGIFMVKSHENTLPFVCDKPVKMLVKRCEFAMKKLPRFSWVSIS